MTDTATVDPPDSIVSPSGGALLLRALRRVEDNLALLLGKLSMAEGKAGVLSCREMNARLATPSLVAGLKIGGAIDAHVFCLVPEPLAVAMSLLAQLKPQHAMTERLAEPVSIRKEERDWVKEVSSFIAAALGDFAKESGGASVLSAPIERFLPDDGPPLESGDDDYLALDALVSLQDVSPMTISLAIPSRLAVAWQSKPDCALAGAAADAAGSAPVLWAVGSVAFAQKARGAAAGFTVRPLHTIAELFSAVSAGAPPAFVIVEVSSGSEFQIEFVAALRKHPYLSGSRVVVALETPTRRHVLRCGVLGLTDVVPSDTPPDVLVRRLLAGR